MKREEKRLGWVLNRYFLLAAVFNLACSAMMQMYNSTISLYIDFLQQPAVLAGTINSVGAVTALAYRIFGGTICERAGRRRMLLAGIPVFAVFSLLCGLTASISLSIVFHILQMIGYAMVTTTLSVAIVDITPKAHMSEGIGYFGLASSLAQAVGPSIAVGLFNTSAGFRAVMIAACCAGIAAAVLTLLFFNYEKDERYSIAAVEKTKKQKKPKQAFSIWTFIEKTALPAACVEFFATFSGGVITLYLTLYASKAGIGNAGLFFTCSVISMVAARLIFGRLSDKYGPLAAVVPGGTLYLVTFALLIFSDENHLLYYLAGVIYGFGSGMTMPALNAEAVRWAPADRKAIASSTYMLPIDIAFTLSAILWSLAIDNLPFRVVFLCAGCISVIFLLLAVLFFGVLKKRPKGIT